MRRLMRAAALVGFGTGLFACSGARVDQFDASLHHICPGQQVEVTWRLTGSATIDAVPPVDHITPGPVNDEGHVSVFPLQTTNIKLHVTRFLGGSTSSTQKIIVQADAGEPTPIGASLSDPTADCTNGKLSVTAKTKAFADTVKVASVAAFPGERHTYVLTHAAVEDTLAPGAISTKFNGLPVGGDWQITTQLLAGEACKPPKLPANLAIDVVMQCDPAGASQ
jgi:hypothetical protein